MALTLFDGRSSSHMADPGRPATEDVWAMPEAAADPQGPRAVRQLAGIARPAKNTAPPVPVPLRPLTLSDMLDGAFETLRIAPTLIFGIAALFVIPLQLWISYLNRDFLNQDLGQVFADAFAAGQSPQTSDLATLVSFVGSMAILPFVAAGVARVHSAWYSGTAIGFGEVAKMLLRRSWVIAIGFVLTRLMGIVVIPLVFTMLFGPVVGMESDGPIGAIKRSFTLVQRRFGLCLGFFLATALVSSVLELALGLLPTAIAATIAVDVGWLPLTVGNIIASTISVAVLASATSLLYIDTRVRTEGLDLQLQAADVFPEANAAASSDAGAAA